EMGTFVRDVLGLAPTTVDGMDAEMFALPDGSTFAVTSPDGPDDTFSAADWLRPGGLSRQHLPSATRRPSATRCRLSCERELLPGAPASPSCRATATRPRSATPPSPSTTASRTAQIEPARNGSWRSL